MTPAAPEDRSSRITALFAGELADRTRRLEEGLLQLEDASPTERHGLLEDLTRAAHTLKGSSALMGASAVAAISHDLEDALGKLAGARSIDTATITRILEDVDRLRQAGAEVVGDRGEPDVAHPPTSPTAPASRDEPRPPGSATATATDTVRVPARKLDALVGRAAALRVATGSLMTFDERLQGVRRELQGRHHGDAPSHVGRRGTADSVLTDLERSVGPLLRGLDRAVHGLDVAVRDVVMVPVAETCDGLARRVRDITAGRDTDVDLRLLLEGVEIDRLAVGVVRDALVHLVNNAADHGIEARPDRQARGKPARGVIEVAASLDGDSVTVTVRDDGRGIDPTSVHDAATAAGLASDAGAHALVFAPGLSTAHTTTDVSGRGVGLDAVRERVESLGGTVTLESEHGRGTTVTLRIPASVATARVLLAETRGHRVAILLNGIRRLARVQERDVVVSDGRSWSRQADGLHLLTSVADIAGLPSAGSTPDIAHGAASPAIVAGSAEQSAALLVDRIVAEQEMLLRPLGPLVGSVPAVVAAGVLPDGHVVLAFHPEALVRMAWARPAGTQSHQVVAEAPRTRRVLLADDAPTTLALERGLLQAAGYEVLAATDGAEAWAMLQDQPVDVVVSDVDMPRLDGVALCGRIRASATLRELPVVLVTSRETDEDRRRGADAGADAYLLKSAFAQGDLITTIARVLG